MNAENPAKLLRTVRYGTVIAREPIYAQAGPHEAPGPQQDRPIGFDIVYEIGGERHVARVPKNPGTRVELDKDDLPLDVQTDTEAGLRTKASPQGRSATDSG